MSGKTKLTMPIGERWSAVPILIVLAVAIRVGMNIWYGQLEWAGEPNTPSFSQLCKRMNTLDVNINKGGMITVTDKKHTQTLAVDSTGLKQHNRGE